MLLISDGLDSDAGEGLGREMERLGKSCRRLIWLNPLLRYDKFEAKPAGIRAMLPFVDEFLPVHNLASLSELGMALSVTGQRMKSSSAMEERASKVKNRSGIQPMEMASPQPAPALS